MAMQLSRLAAQQKRILDWQEFLAQGGAPTPKIRAESEAAITRLKTLIARSWQAKVITTEDESEIARLLARIEMLNEEARLAGRGNTTIRKASTFRSQSTQLKHD